MMDQRLSSRQYELETQLAEAGIHLAFIRRQQHSARPGDARSRTSSAAKSVAAATQPTQSGLLDDELKSLIRHLQHAAVFLDSRGQIQYANLAMRELLEIPTPLPSEDDSRSEIGFRDYVVLEDQSDYDLAWNRIGNHRQTFHLRLIASSGRNQTVQFTFCELPEAFCTLADASPHDKALLGTIGLALPLEETASGVTRNPMWTKDILDSVDEAVVAVDLDGRIEYMNAVAEDLTGWSSPRALEQPVERVVRLLAASASDGSENLVHQCLESGRDFDPSFHLQLSSADGNRFPIEAKSTPITDSMGVVRGAVLFFRDITWRRQSEEAIRVSQSRLNSILAAGEIGTWEFDIADDRVEADPNLIQIFGIDEPTAGGASFSDYLAAIHPDDRELVVNKISKALKSDDIVEVVYRVILGQQTRWLMARGRVERDAKGKPIRLPGAIIDITSERLAEEQVRISESRWRLALEAAELGAWNIDPQTRTLTSDERFRRIFTGSTDPLDYDQSFEAIHPEDRRQVRELVAAATDPDNPRPYNATFRVCHPDGTIRWVHSQGRASFEWRSGQRLAVRFDGAVMDITERSRIEESVRESEARFRQLADAIPQLAWMAEPDGNINWYNQRWYEYTGKSPAEMEGWGWQSVHDPEALPKVLERWKASLSSGEPFSMAFPLRGADGNYRMFLTRVMPLRDRDGNITRWFGTNTDISSQHQLQEELLRIAAKLSESDRRKDEFLATLAHELRNPLAPVKSAVQLMQRSPDVPSEFRELTDVVDRQVAQMVRLIDDLLDVSRISRGIIELKSKPCDLKEVIQGAVEAATPFVKQSGHQLHIRVEDQPLLVMGDSTRLTQILVNLLNNAAKYTLEPGDIWLDAIATDDQVVLSVRDNGVGISEEERTRVFEMFHQIRSDKQHGQSGLGIGLSLVKSLVALHQGEIEVESEGNKRGSTFRVRLPRLTQAPDTDSDSKPSNQQNTRRPSLRVLVVEDADPNRILLVRLLTNLGHQVEQAANGIEGLEKAGQFQPELILTDISMPKMNGYEMVQKLRQTDQSTHVVALSGYGQDTDREMAKGVGFDNYLVKPVDIRDLEHLIDSLTESKSTTNQDSRGLGNQD